VLKTIFDFAILALLFIYIKDCWEFLFYHSVVKAIQKSFKMCRIRRHYLAYYLLLFLQESHIAAQAEFGYRLL